MFAYGTIVVLGGLKTHFYAWVLAPVWILLGCVVTSAVLLGCPRIYERLRKGITTMKTKMCTVKCNPSRCLEPSEMDNPVYNPGNNETNTQQKGQVANHNYDYTEIDMKKTQTFLPLDKAQKPRLRYEDCVIGRDSHTYLGCSGELKQESGDQQNRISAQHNYAILEPGSNKRLSVRILTEDLKDDPNNVYFRLEPGTNKVIPQAKVNSKDLKDHTYFVLEAKTDTDNADDDMAYAVNELSDHNYYILETE